MAGPQAEPVEARPALPPRQPGVLAHYSRASKLAGTALALVGVVAVVYLLGQLLPKAPSPIAEQQAPSAQAPSETTTAGIQLPIDANATLGDGAAAKDTPLTPAPDPALTETTPDGSLPRIADDGRQPWQVYARPFNPKDAHPHVAIVVTDLGLQSGITTTALTQLPGAVTLAFDAQSPTLSSWCANARQQGHEILLTVPMEPLDFPHSDPGPHTLLTTASDTINLDKLNWALRQGIGYVGITTMSGSRFTAESEKMKPVMEALHQRGLLMFDAGTTPHSAIHEIAHTLSMPAVVATSRIDDNMDPDAIDAALQQLKQTAQLSGRAIAVVTPTPVALDHIRAWLKTLPQDGITLVPVSAMIEP